MVDCSGMIGVTKCLDTNYFCVDINICLSRSAFVIGSLSGQIKNSIPRLLISHIQLCTCYFILVI